MNYEVTESRSHEVAETQSSEVAETQSHGDTKSRSHEVTETAEVTADGAVDSEALFNRLKGELMEEIRKYFEPIVKEAGKEAVPPMPPAPPALVETVEALPDEDDLIVKLLEETGWRNG